MLGHSERAVNPRAGEVQCSCKWLQNVILTGLEGAAQERMPDSVRAPHPGGPHHGAAGLCPWLRADVKATSDRRWRPPEGQIPAARREGPILARIRLGCAPGAQGLISTQILGTWVEAIRGLARRRGEKAVTGDS